MSHQRREEITKTEATRSSVSITLNNGVTVVIASNPGYIHVHMSGIDGKIEVEQNAANNLNVKYQARES